MVPSGSYRMVPSGSSSITISSIPSSMSSISSPAAALAFFASSAAAASASSAAAASSSSILAASASASRLACSACMFSTTCCTASGGGMITSGRSLRRETRPSTAAFLACSTPHRLSTVSAPRHRRACSGGVESSPASPTQRSVALMSIPRSPTAARCRMAGSSARSAISVNGSSALPLTIASANSGTSARVARAPAAAIWVFGSSLQAKETNIFMSVHSGSMNLAAISSLVTRLESVSTTARWTISLVEVRAICSTRQPPRATILSRNSGTVARLHNAMEPSKVISSLSPSSTSLRRGAIIPSGPDPVRRG
mmetsp:Transcript_48849/g.109928  ORF Transcript_48849/g.109928 Transcript_48849/m.109928 type:complete len:312 (+) Transcript_48849:3-938(+)